MSDRVPQAVWLDVEIRFWVSAIIFVGSLRPEYSHFSQYISELGERGSSSELMMRYAVFVPTGLMHIVFAVFLFVAFKDSPVAKLAAMLIAVNGIARIGAGMFPCGCLCSRLNYGSSKYFPTPQGFTNKA